MKGGVDNNETKSTVTLTEGKYSDEKLDDSWSEDTAGTLTLNKDSITSDDKTVQIDKTTATITEAGTYILTGTLTDGQIIVDAEDKGDVKLVLNDADINCSSSAPIYIKSGNTVITLADGTENSVSDGEEYIYEKEDDDEPNAAIFAKDDLTFNGSGSLTVTGNYNHAIQSKDDLKFVAGTFDIQTNGAGQNMSQNPSESSTQLVITRAMNQPVPVGTSITLKNSSGTTLAEVTTEKNVQWYAISTPELKEGETYTICIGDKESSVTLNATITQI